MSLKQAGKQQEARKRTFTTYAVPLFMLMVAAVVMISGLSNTQVLDFLKQRVIYDTADRIIPEGFRFPYEGDVIEDKEYAFTHEGHSGGSAAYTLSPDARIILTFTGTEAHWYGYTSPYNQKADIYLDGQWMAQIDLYSGELETGKLLYASPLLKSGLHTLAIAGTGERNDQGKNDVIGVDYFTVKDRNQELIVYEDGHGAITYVHPNRAQLVQFTVRKAGHVAIYSMFAGLLILLFRMNRRWRKAIPSIPVLIFGAAWLDEYRQSLTPDRHSSWTDVGFDMAGALAVMMVYVLVKLAKRWWSRVGRGESA